MKDDKSGEIGEYIDGIDNHFLLANGYSALAEQIGGDTKTVSAGAFTAADVEAAAIGQARTGFFSRPTLART